MCSRIILQLASQILKLVVFEESFFDFAVGVDIPSHSFLDIIFEHACIIIARDIQAPDVSVPQVVLEHSFTNIPTLTNMPRNPMRNIRTPLEEPNAVIILRIFPLELKVRVIEIEFYFRPL